MTSMRQIPRTDRQSTAVTDWLGRTSAEQHSTQERIGENNAKLILTLTGWRRRCLFGLLLTLTVIVIINLSLTLWLLRSMQFSLVSSYSFPFFSLSIEWHVVCFHYLSYLTFLVDILIIRRSCFYFKRHNIHKISVPFFARTNLFINGLSANYAFLWETQHKPVIKIEVTNV